MTTRNCGQCGRSEENDAQKNCKDCAFPLDAATPASGLPAAAQKEHEKMQKALDDATIYIKEQEDEIARLKCTPLVYATVLSSNHVADPQMFVEGDEVRVVDDANEHSGRHGKITKVDRDADTVEVKVFTNEGETLVSGYRIGMSDKVKPQVHLVGKNDGTNIITVLDGKTYEVWNHHGFDPKPGDTAKCNLESNQVVEVAAPSTLGDMVRVIEQLEDNKIQVEVGGNKRVVHCPYKAEPSDYVILDPSSVVVVKLISNDNTQRYKIKVEQRVAWNQIGGCHEAKAELQEALVMPTQFPYIFEHYNQKIPAGILLYGPPGCGKTLVARAAAASLAEVHGKHAVQSGFNYIKGPEILSKWVGDSEAETRAIFQRKRKHYEMHGYPSVTFVDEADAIFTERGSNDSQKWHDTLVAQWLSEMDGFDETHGMLIFATNRPSALDGAITREGRIDKHIKIPRPDKETTREIFEIHLQDVPLEGTEKKEVCGVVSEEIMSDKKQLYSVAVKGKTAGHMTLGDTISGSMIAGIIKTATSSALKRDLARAMKTKKKVTPKGVTMDDFLTAVNSVFYRHRSLNHRFDQLDFCDTNGLDAKGTVFKKAPQMIG